MSQDFDYDVVRGGPPVDPRIVEEIEKTPRMISEQGSGFMNNYGGPTNYKIMAKLDETPRLVYAAMLQGHTSYDDIAYVTMLKLGEVESATKTLEKTGLIKRQAIPTPVAEETPLA